MRRKKQVLGFIGIFILMFVVSGQSLSLELEYDKKPRISNIEYLDLIIDLLKREKTCEIILSEAMKKKDVDLVILACEQAMHYTEDTINELLSIKPPLKYEKDYNGHLLQYCTYFYYLKLRLELFEEGNWEDERDSILRKVLTQTMEDSPGQHSKEGSYTPESALQETIKQGKRDYETEIKAYAKKKWPDDYRMQVYEYDKQMKAFNQIRNLPSTTDYNESILSKAMAKWEENYRMIIYEYNKQLESYKKMR